MLFERNNLPCVLFMQYLYTFYLLRWKNILLQWTSHVNYVSNLILNKNHISSINLFLLNFSNIILAVILLASFIEISEILNKLLNISLSTLFIPLMTCMCMLNDMFPLFKQRLQNVESSFHAQFNLPCFVPAKLFWSVCSLVSQQSIKKSQNVTKWRWRDFQHFCFSFAL